MERYSKALQGDGLSYGMGKHACRVEEVERFQVTAEMGADPQSGERDDRETRRRTYVEVGDIVVTG